MEALAIEAATLVAKWVVEAAAKKTGEAAFVSLRPIYDWVKSKFTGSTEQAVVDKLTTEPGNPENTANLAKAIEARLSAEPELRNELTGLLKAAAADKTIQMFLLEIKHHARAGKVITIGTIIGNVSI